MQEQNANDQSVILILEPEREAGEALMEVLSKSGYSPLLLPDIDRALIILQNGAAGARLMILSTDAGNNPADLDQLLKFAHAGFGIIVYGIDRGGKTALYCLTNGAMDFLRKPFQEKELLAVVGEALDRQSPVTEKDRHSTGNIIASSPVSGWVEITASSELEQLRRMQRFSDALFSLSLSKDVCEDLKMAMEEVGRNAVEWGNKFDPQKKVEISYCVFKDRIVLKFKDEGEGFKPDLSADPTLDPARHVQDRQDAGKRPGGYGIFLLQRLMDEVVFNEKGNIVVMTKFINQD